ncbi:MAG TPA: hypothetical protein VLM85_07280 [Polyangiaceae bacterium]|nr:hypothetical protein [Polyangiaceae bacterium]
MYLVAVCGLATSVEQEALILASETGVAAYETRLRLSRGLPAIVLRTADKDAAVALLGRLRARGHEAVACDEAAVASGERIVHVRNFRLGADALEGDTASLPYSSMLALVRAMRPLRTDVTQKIAERRFRPGMAIATGGVVLTKKVTREVSRTERDKEDVLYLFATGSPPWLLAERRLVYASLEGPAPTQRENFVRVVNELRERAGLVPYDERLVAFRPQNDEPDLAERDLELHAHVLALALHSRAKRR